MDFEEEDLTDLHGLSLAAVFRRVVLEHPDVIAAGRDVIAQTGRYAEVFRDGQSARSILGHVWSLNVNAEDLAYDFVAPIVYWIGRPRPKAPPVIVRAAAALTGRLSVLRRMLVDGLIIAKGTYVSTGMIGEIGRLQWTREGMLIDVRNSDLLEPVDHKPVIRWSGIGVELAAPRASHGSATRKATARVESKAAALHECTAWLIGHMKESPTERQDTKEVWWERARAKWPKALSERGFNAAWADAVRQSKASAWAAAGAPRKNTTQKSTR